jgi:hypothetical protein
MVEQGVREIVREITDKEFLSQRSTGGTMRWLNKVLEELRICHEEHKVPPKVLASIEEKKRKAITKNATAVVKSKKQKGARASIAKKQRISATVAASVASSASGSTRASANIGEGFAKNSGGGPTFAGAEAEKSNTSRDIGGDQGVLVFLNIYINESASVWNYCCSFHLEVFRVSYFHNER